MTDTLAASVSSPSGFSDNALYGGSSADVGSNPNNVDPGVFNPAADYGSDAPAGDLTGVDNAGVYYGLSQLEATANIRTRQFAQPAATVAGFFDPTGGLGRAVETAGGEDFVQGAQMAQSFWTLPRDQLMEFQKALYEGHFYADRYYSGRNPPIPRFGSWDTQSYDAWTRAIKATTVANSTKQGSDLTFEDVIHRAAGGETISDLLGGGGGGRGGVGRRVSLTNADDIAVVTRRVAEKLLGRAPTSDELNAVIGDLHGKESNLSQNAPTAEAEAQQLLRARDPVEAGAHDLANVYGLFLDLLGHGHPTL